MIPLSRWLAAQDAPRPVCERADGELDSARLCSDVAALSQALARRGPGRYLLCTESAYSCAVALLALWQARAIAVMPPNLEPGSLRELAPGARGLLADRNLEPVGLEALAILGHPAPAKTMWRELEPAATVLELCTSGSTGARKLVPKTLAQLETEIDALERELGADGGSLRVHGTVSFQHIYGLLFRVLWPLCAGRVFADLAIVDPALIAAAFESRGRGWLVSSPAHLKRLPELLDLARLRPTCAEVFSSGGALDAATALRFERELGRAPLEVLGSTETGGIAWRRQGARGDAAWCPFPGVQVEARDGLLAVRSGPAGGGEAVTTGDAVELAADGRFRLLGRADRIVKLFDERVSLAEIEARLGAHAWVESAAALATLRLGTPRIAAVVVLTPSGAQELAARGKPALVAGLRAHLKSFFRDTALPRAWRIAPRLPEDAQGKTSVDALEALFQGPQRSLAPTPVGSRAQDETSYELELEVPADLWCLRGHFDGFPVVPGVVQLQWALDCAADWLGALPDVRGVEALKYKRILAGGTRFRLRLERGADAAKLRFRLWNDSGEFSSGRVLLGTGGP